MLIAVVATACGSQSATSPNPTPVQDTIAPSVAGAATSSAAAPQTDAPGATPHVSTTVWLCKPGKPNNPCEATLKTTSIDAAGKRSVETLTPAADPGVDCFYVYPTTSRQATSNADLTIDPELVTIATWQAAPFSQVCKVYAPVYPQLTIAGLNSGRVTGDQVVTAYSGVLQAFDDYLANDNHGRGIVLIGHSQGAMILISLLQDRVEAQPEIRKLLVSALLMGGSATTAPGKTTGGDFAEIPTCEKATQVGCVVGYSSFDELPPQDAMFGRLETAAWMLRAPQSGEQLMCVNPAALVGDGVLRPLIATSDMPRLTADPPKPLPDTTFVSYPGAYRAECQTDGSATWLNITRPNPAAAPKLVGTEGRSWGLHDFDLSLPLGNLIELVRTEAAAYRP